MVTTLLKSRKVKLRNQEVTRIVLRHDSAGYHPFVVHTQVFPVDREPFFTSGDYFEGQQFEDAVKVFGDRAQRDLTRAREQREEQDARLISDIRSAP